MRSDACRAARWSTSEAPSVPHGGFVLGAELLDSSAFGLSEAEASAMDPQQRLVLELGYDALHGAAERRASLLGSDGGVCVGIERPDWALVQPPSVRGSGVRRDGRQCVGRERAAVVRAWSARPVLERGYGVLVGARGGAVCDAGGVLERVPMGGRSRGEPEAVAARHADRLASGDAVGGRPMQDARRGCGRIRAL